MSREFTLGRSDRRRAAWLALAACALCACSAFDGFRVAPSDAGTGGVGPSDAGTGGVGPSDAGTGGVGPSDAGTGGVGPSDAKTDGVGPSDAKTDGVGPSDASADGVGPSDAGTDGEPPTDAAPDRFTVPTDGNDTDANVDAGGIEVCNNLDDDRDGSIDDGVCIPTDVVGGNEHTCALLDGARIKCWGGNASGQLGLGDTLARGDGQGQMGKNLPIVDLGVGRTATALAAYYLHTCALLDNGQVKCWGYNGSGELGTGDTFDRGSRREQMGDNLPAVSLGTGRVATAIAAGGGHSCALLDNGQVKCWGYNGYGQLGLGDLIDRGRSVASMGDNLPAVSLGTGRTATAIDAGGKHTCALLDNGQVKCWGNAGFGQLGLGDKNTRGDDAGEMGDALAPVSLGTGRTATAINVGDTHTCALLDNGEIKCWGNSGLGQLGLGDANHRGDDLGEMGDALAPVSLGTGRTATGIEAGSSHTCALLDNAQVKCWGSNFAGPLGLGDRLHRGDAPGEMGDSLPAVDFGTGRIPKTITAGAFHNCALLDNAQLKCWGHNVYGQLGQGDTQNRGDNANEMGDNLPFVSF